MTPCGIAFSSVKVSGVIAIIFLFSFVFALEEGDNMSLNMSRL